VSHTRQTLCGDGDTRTYTRRNVIALHYPVYKNSHTLPGSLTVAASEGARRGGGGHAEARVRPEPGNGTSSDSHAKKLHSQSITRTVHTHTRTQWAAATEAGRTSPQAQHYSIYRTRRPPRRPGLNRMKD